MVVTLARLDVTVQITRMLCLRCVIVVCFWRNACVISEVVWWLGKCGMDLEMSEFNICADCVLCRMPVGMINMWDVWGCCHTCGILYFGISCCAVPDDFEVYTDALIIFCGSGKLLWRMVQWSVTLVQSTSRKIGVFERGLPRMCKVIAVCRRNDILNFFLYHCKGYERCSNCIMYCFIIFTINDSWDIWVWKCVDCKL